MAKTTKLMIGLLVAILCVMLVATASITYVVNAEDETEEHNHDWSAIEYVPNDDGKTHSQTCTVCGDVKKEAHVITNVTSHKATGHTGDCELCLATNVTVKHTWNNGVVTKEPTETETGERLYTCTTCGESIPETIQATGSNEPENPINYTDIFFLFLLIVLAILLVADVILLIWQIAKPSSKIVVEAEQKQGGSK